MNAERLHAIALVLQKEMSATNIVGKVEALRSALQTMVNQNHPQHQQTLADSLQAVYAALAETPSDGFSPAWRQLLLEMGGENLFGAALKKTIQDIFQRNQITLAVAQKELEELKTRLESFQKALNQINQAFIHFRIGDEKLEPGECEIGMLIPRDAVDNNLIGFANELKELIFVLNTFSEVATGKPDELLIKTISSSDLTVYLDAHAPFAACLAVAIERIVALYKQLLEIKKIRCELLKQGVPEKQMAGIESHANSAMQDGIEILIVEILEKHHKGKDGPRKHELTTALRISLNRIANRIDRGYNIEVRTEPLQEGAQESESGVKKLEQIATIQAATKNMQFMKLEGTPILQLPESCEKPKVKKE